MLDLQPSCFATSEPANARLRRFAQRDRESLASAEPLPTLPLLLPALYGMRLPCRSAERVPSNHWHTKPPRGAYEFHPLSGLSCLDPPHYAYPLTFHSRIPRS